MSSQSPHPASSVHELRAAARRQARGFPMGLTLLASTGLAALSIAVFAVLDYRFHQDPHRIVKLMLGLSLVGAIVAMPMIGFTLMPIATPFLPWMPKLPIPGMNALNVLLFVVFGSWALGRVTRKLDVFRPSRLGTTIGWLLLIAALSIVRGGAFPTGYTYHVGEAVYALVRSSATFAVYFIGLAMARGEKARRRLSWAIVIGLMAEAAVTAAYGRSGRGQRAVGSFGQSNELGAYLAMFTAFSAAMIPGTRNLLGRATLLGALLLGSFGVLLSVSRGAILALAASLLFVGLRSSRVLTALLLVALVSSPLWVPDYVIHRITGSRIETEDEEGRLEGSAQIRIDTWHAIATLVSNHPLEGVGFAGLGYVLPETGAELGIEVKDSAHNTYLRFVGEMGVIGLSLFLMLLWGCARLSADATRLARTRFDRQLAVGFGAATLAMAISCVFGDRFFSILITGNFWMLAALVNDSLLDRPQGTA
ncbi:MAG: O-antigen ligase family protein [Candidatus Eisenbacteria bacterium]|nr:O-antigen ligase family protein [Candidatus Eisenbacteria bacterium]